MSIYINPLTLESKQSDTYIIINKYDEYIYIVTEDNTHMEIEVRYLSYPPDVVTFLYYH